MKKTLTLIALLVSFSLCKAQQLSMDQNFKVRYMADYNVSGTNKTELYKRAMFWLACNYDKDIVIFQDTESGFIFGKAFERFNKKWIGYNVEILIKDNTYRIKCSSFYVKGKGELKNDTAPSELKKSVDSKMILMQQQLQAIMFSPLPSELKW